MLHPRAIKPAGPAKALGVGIWYSILTDRSRVILKSDKPLVIFPAHQGVAAVAADEKLSPAKLPDELSKDFCQVKETSACKPWLIFFA
jgi:hypothetical protein